MHLYIFLHVVEITVILGNTFSYLYICMCVCMCRKYGCTVIFSTLRCVNKLAMYVSTHIYLLSYQHCVKNKTKLIKRRSKRFWPYSLTQAILPHMLTSLLLLPKKGYHCIHWVTGTFRLVILEGLLKLWWVGSARWFHSFALPLEYQVCPLCCRKWNVRLKVLNCIGCGALAEETESEGERPKWHL